MNSLRVEAVADKRLPRTENDPDQLQHVLSIKIEQPKVRRGQLTAEEELRCRGQTARLRRKQSSKGSHTQIWYPALLTGTCRPFTEP